jgi:hypothetical protein
MNRGIAIKIGIILGFFTLVLGLAYGCSSIKYDQKTPQITNGDDTYLTVGDIEITNQELWNAMKLSDGLTYLNKYVDETLLADYIGSITQEQIDTRVQQAIYGSNDPESIAKIKEHPDQEEQLILAYERTLILQGLDPENAEDVRHFFELSIAREMYTDDYIKGITDENSSLFISDEDLKTYYEDHNKGDVCALTLRFQSYDEYQAVFDYFNIVPDYQGSFGQYIGDTPITDVPTADFDDTNTTVMTEEEVFAAFIDMYNYLYPNQTQLDDTTALTVFCDTYGNDFQFQYDVLTDKYLSNTYQNSLADQLWDTLAVTDPDPDDDVEPKRFTTKPVVIGDFQVMAFKVSEATVSSYDELSQEEKDAIYASILEEKRTTDVISQAMDELRSKHEFEIFDPILKLQYENQNLVTFDNNGDDLIIARLDGTDITANMLFDYMKEQIGSFTAMQLVQKDVVLYSDYYTEQYGDSHDYLESKNSNLVDYRTQLREMKSYFSSDGYAQYGFSSRDYTWDEFIILAFGQYNEFDVLQNIFVISTLQPYLVEDMIKYDNAAPFIQKQFDDYFSLDVTHLLLYLDNNMDFTPDEFNTYVDSLENADLDAYNALISSFEDLVKSKINNDGYTLDEIVSEYQASLVGDTENEWAPFKAYGFYIKAEDLSQQGSLTNQNTGNYDEDFVTALKRIYDAYVEIEKTDDLDQYIDDRLSQSNFGLHFILATKGDDFEQPSAKFDATDTDYDPSFNNENDVPNQAQIENYIAIEFAQKVKENPAFTMPTNVRDAVETYYKAVFDTYFTTTGYSIATAQYMLDNDVQFAAMQEDETAFLQNVITILYEVGFPEEYLTPADLDSN